MSGSGEEDNYQDEDQIEQKDNISMGKSGRPIYFY